MVQRRRILCRLFGYRYGIGNIENNRGHNQKFKFKIMNADRIGVMNNKCHPTLILNFELLLLIIIIINTAIHYFGDIGPSSVFLNIAVFLK
jgi:hypothetical protein